MATIEYFFVSKVRIKLLQLFFFNPEDDHHVRGVVREVDEEINAVRRELVRMEKAKMLASERKGNRLYFKLRPDFIFFNEFLSLVHKEFGLGRAIIKSKSKIGDITYAILTRDFTHNMRNPHSEVDLVVVGNTIDLNELNSVIRQEQAFVGREINYTVLKLDEFNLRKKRNDSFVTSLLKGSKIVLLGNEDELLS